MTFNYTNAVDQMFALFNTAWVNQTVPIVGYVPVVRWQGVEELTKPDASKYWARVSQQTILEEQRGFSTFNGSALYSTRGLIFVQIFCPKSDIKAMEKGRSLAVVARNAFRGKTTSGKVWFKNCTINELSPEESFFRLNVVSNYNYDETS